MKDIELENNPESDRMKQELELHRKAATFYKRKRKAKDLAQIDNSTEAVIFDFQKNLCTPNKTSNNVYYKCQLTCVSFNVHILSTDDVYFHFYDETVAKKGAHDVCSMLYHFIERYIPQVVTRLDVFCDGCAGQNKNYTLLRFMHWLVNTKRRFEHSSIRFPICGHSYLECDRDMALIKQSTDLDLPSQWVQVFRNARVKPSRFTVIPCNQNMFKAFKDFLKPGYKTSCPFKTRPLREVYIEASHPQYISFRDSWNGTIETAVVILKLVMRMSL